MENTVYAVAEEKSKSIQNDSNTFDNLKKVTLDCTYKDKDILEMLFNEYDLIEKIKDDNIDNLIILKRFLVDYEAIVSAFVSKFNNPNVLDELHKYWDNKRKVIGQLIDGNSDLNPYSELESILNYTNDYYNSLIDDNSIKFSINKSNKNDIAYANDNISTINFTDDEFRIPQIDELYSKLYESINSKNLKKETVYRGRLIRALKKNKELIADEYKKVKCLDEINSLLSNNSNFNDIIEILKRDENKLYFEYFSNFISNKDKFINKFIDLYEKKHVKKKTMYNNALNDELKEHGRVLDERFSNEFLEKRGTLKSLVTVLPNAIALSAKKLGNTINELREAKSNRMKVAKGIQAMKDTGIVIATPAIYMGKFLVNNWYALYSINRGVVAAKKLQLEEEQARQAQEDADRKVQEAKADEKARIERERINAERGNAIAKEEQRKAQEAREIAEKREMAAKAEAEVKAREEAARKQAEAYAQAQEMARKEAERREMMNSYNKAIKERAEAEARYHHEAGTYRPDTSTSPDPAEKTIDDVCGSEELMDIPGFNDNGRVFVPSINPIFF